MGQEQDGGSLLGDQALLDPDGPLPLRVVPVVGVWELVVPLPGPAAVRALGVFGPAVQVVVGGVGVEGHDPAVGVFHADGPAVGAASRSVVLEIGDDVPEDVIAQFRGGVVVVDPRPVDSPRIGSPLPRPVPGLLHRFPQPTRIMTAITKAVARMVICFSVLPGIRTGSRDYYHLGGAVRRVANRKRATTRVAPTQRTGGGARARRGQSCFCFGRGRRTLPIRREPGAEVGKPPLLRNRHYSNHV